MRNAEDQRLHVFLSSSDIHMAHQLNKDREQVLEQARESVARAKGFVDNVEFSPMDATRSDVDFVYRMLTECIAAGATTINIPDTVGYAIPEEFQAFIESSAPVTTVEPQRCPQSRPPGSTFVRA